MSWWERKRGDDQPGPIRRAVRSIYERPERMRPDDGRRETRLSMEPYTGEIWSTGEPRPPRVDDLDELDWTELGGIDRDTSYATVDYSKASRWRPLRDILWRR
jgi:hypothetical protein